MSIKGDVVSLDPGSLVELFVLDATAIGGTVNRFHAGTNGVLGSIIWQGQNYSPWPVQASGFEVTGAGRLPRPRLGIANVAGTISGMVMALDDLVGAKVTRKRTLARYLDGGNFPGGVNPSADPLQAFPDDEFYVDRKVSETRVFVEFELAAKVDLDGVKVPLRVVTQTCAWVYRGEGCGYAGSAVARADDTATADPNLDSCGKRITSCKLRFGANAVLPYGGFPAAGTIK